MPSVVYRSVTENFGDLLSDASGRKAGKQRSSRFNANIYWAAVKRNLTQEIWLVQVEKDLNRNVKIWWIMQPEIW